MARKRVWLAVGSAVAAGAAWFAMAAISRARLAESAAREAVESAGRFAAPAREVDRRIPQGWDLLTARGGFTDFAILGGKIVLASAGGLEVRTADGALLARYRAGGELPPARLTRIARRAPGELWIATQGAGLLLFDGRGFRQVLPRDARQAKVSALLPLPNGRLLLGTDDAGVFAYDGADWTRFHEALAGIPVTDLAGDEGDLWIATRDRGLLRWRAGALTTIGTKDGLPDRQVLSLAARGTSVYAGTPLGVAELRDGKVVRGIAEGHFAQAVETSGGQLWIGTLEEGLVAANLTASAGRVRAPRSTWCADCPVRRLRLEGGELLALLADRLARVSEGRFETLVEAAPGALADGNVSALALDAAGRLWIGYFDRGLEIAEPGFSRTRHFERDPVYCVNRIVPTGSGALVATANGLALFDAGGTLQRVLTRADGLIANHVTDVLAGPGGALTIATPAGLTFLGRGGAASLYAFHGLVNNHVYALAASGRRTVAGTLGGLSAIDAGRVTASYTTANSNLGHNWITALAPDGDGWLVGTYGAGVLRLDRDGRWHASLDWQGKGEINPNALRVTPETIYAGTLGQGLAVYRRSTGRWTFWKNHLPSLSVTAIERAGSNLYLGTDNGLVRVPEARILEP